MANKVKIQDQNGVQVFPITHVSAVLDNDGNSIDNLITATISVGSVTTGSAGTDAQVTNSGTAKNAVLNFTIPKGPKGDTVILGEGEEYTLYNVPGQNTDGAMTQKAVTDLLNSSTLNYISPYLPTENGCLARGSAIWSVSNTYTRRHYLLEVTNEKGLKITANASLPAVVGFLKTYSTPSTHGQEVDYCNGYSLPVEIPASETQVLQIPEDCNYVVINRKNYDYGYPNRDFTPASILLGYDVSSVGEQCATPLLVSKQTLSSYSNGGWVIGQQVQLKFGHKYKIKLSGTFETLYTYSVTASAVLGLYASGENVSNHPSGVIGIKNFNPIELQSSWESDVFEVTNNTLKYLNIAYRIISGSISFTVYEVYGDLQANVIETDNNTKAINAINNGEVSVMPMRYQSDYAARHFVPLTSGFSVINGFKSTCSFHNTSNSYTEGTIGILGEPTDNFSQRFAFRNSGDTNTQISVVVVTENGDHVITNNTGSAHSLKWYYDGTNSNMPFINPIEIKVENGNLSVSLIGSIPVQIITDTAEVKSVYLKIKTSKDTDIVMGEYINNGYTTLLHTHPQVYHLPFPMDVYNNTLYIAYYRPNGYLTVYSRNFLTGVVAESQKTVLRTGDDHEWISMIIDDDGCMQIMCNCHASALYYLYGSVSDIDDIAISDKLSWNKATYPNFIKNGSDLFATFRDMASNGGRWKVYRFDYSNKTYSTTTNEWICDGTKNGTASQNPDSACPYWEQWVIDKENGWYYNAFCWRDTTDAVSNHDICFIKTQDFQTFYNYKGEQLTLPITINNKNLCMVKFIPTGHHLLNQTGIRTLLVNGNPVIIYGADDDKGNTNIFMVSFENGECKTRMLTNKVNQEYHIIYLEQAFIPNFASFSICTQTYQRTFSIGEDMSVYESEIIDKNIVPSGGKTCRVQTEDWRLYSSFCGFDVTFNYDSTYNYGVQKIE